MISNLARESGRIDRMAIGLSALCGVHCLVTALFAGLLASASTFLKSPLIHEYGLVLAILLGLFSIGLGALRHRRLIPLTLGLAGLALMALGLMLPHGGSETIATLCGVTLLSIGHVLNARHNCAI